MCAAAGEGVDPDVLVRIRDLVSQGCKSSQSLDRKGGIHVLEVMGRRGDTHMGSHTCVEVSLIVSSAWTSCVG